MRAMPAVRRLCVGRRGTVTRLARHAGAGDEGPPLRVQSTSIGIQLLRKIGGAQLVTETTAQ
jgi:hypothetical protein